MIVIDASVALKWIKEEELFRDKALELFQNHKTDKNQIIVPDLIYIEVSNVLVTKSSFTDDNVKQALRFLFKAELKNYELSEKYLVDTSVLAKKYQTSVYDMLYAVIAKKLKTVLITADVKFIQKTNFPYVKLLSEYST